MRTSLITTAILLFISILSDLSIYYKWIKPTHKYCLNRIYLIVSSIFAIFILTIFIFLQKSKDDFLIEIATWFYGIFMIIYIPKFILILSLLLNKLATATTGINTKAITKTGFILSIITAGGLLYGTIVGRFDIEVKQVEIHDQSLPASFDKLKIVQISDLHVGSVQKDSKYWTKAVKIINDQRPDIIVMTGDMINNFATELTPELISTLSKLKAGIAKYSILGNHDYGDYTQWDSPIQKQANLDSLKAREKRMGFKLLIDEHVLLTRSSDTMVIAGVQNWSKPPFHCYGNLAKAIHNTAHFPYVLLLSHDPNHWKAQVLQHPNIRLTLSGHTHGMQLGINRFGIHWSPAQWVFPQWDGLYTDHNATLYVNRGLGYIGIPVRLGMPPEITVITLKTKP